MIRDLYGWFSLLPDCRFCVVHPKVNQLREKEKQNQGPSPEMKAGFFQEIRPRAENLNLRQDDSFLNLYFRPLVLLLGGTPVLLLERRPLVLLLGGRIYCLLPEGRRI